jgi:hypothetical protein
MDKKKKVDPVYRKMKLQQGKGKRLKTMAEA